MAGVTFLAFGNGSPDVFSTFAAMSTHSGSLAVGELIGAAGFITAVIAGSMAIVRPFKVAKKSFVRDVGFFIVAASFSMVFLADGYLHLWESVTMIAFYIFYVVTVVIWHWYLSQRRRRKLREVAARNYFDLPEPSIGDAEATDEESNGIGERDRLLISNPSEDFAALERGNSPMDLFSDDEDDDETRDRWMAEISSNMRVNRPSRRGRRNTATPIRPSLVGALEFRAVLSSLSKSRNLQAVPINLRRYSDDPSYLISQQQPNLSFVSNPEAGHEGFERQRLAANTSQRPSSNVDRCITSVRARAVSANDANALRLDLGGFQGSSVSQTGLLDTDSSPTLRSALSNGLGSDLVSSQSGRLPSPSVVISPADLQSSRRDLTAPPNREESPTHLAPPHSGVTSLGRPCQIDVNSTPIRDILPGNSPAIAAELIASGVRNAHSSNAGLSSPSAFPTYQDNPDLLAHRSRSPSVLLPPSSLETDSIYPYPSEGQRPIRWWPHKVLPTPQVLMSALFPTLYSWSSKNIWEKLLGIVTAPSVFLLAITLPVIETEKEDGAPGPDPGILSSSGMKPRSRSSTNAQLPLDSLGQEPMNYEAVGALNGSSHSMDHHHHQLVPPVTSISEASRQDLHSIDAYPHDLTHLNESPELQHPGRSSQRRVPSVNPIEALPSSPKDWNRWLVAVQLFTGPFFIVLLVWANTDPTFSLRNFVLPWLYSLVLSLVLLAVLLLTTTDSKPPRYRYLLCFLGFLVSIAWISTIANEVVGVLKALGVILGISDAILGLTIFAVGNSLGDLVADITVAKLGYPVMALSACFGGPMLNILLGIGISGTYMTIREGKGKHERHPQQPIHYEPFRIEVGGTLLISGITLLVTLVGLLIVVPLNRWKMDRRIGWGLVALWSISTAGNLAVEISGWDGRVA